ncbi:hypothetical protein CEXT_324791 [Caerostris extrusa]|uniref:Uncharacterized protein n=1 Tax=Caerostris extrusa TaxID=172846 RepID=A0AAV4WJV2_CAEEX|nr:hypothetical protein CEXT_324791 [Caerostris extrusa]
MMFQPGDSVGESNYHKFLGNKLCWDTIPPCISWTVRNGWCIVWLQAGAGNPGDDVVKSSHYLSRLCVTTGFDLGGQTSPVFALGWSKSPRDFFQPSCTLLWLHFEAFQDESGSFAGFFFYNYHFTPNDSFCFAFTRPTTSGFL